jgi:hypothetical protein
MRADLPQLPIHLHDLVLRHRDSCAQLVIVIIIITTSLLSFYSDPPLQNRIDKCFILLIPQDECQGSFSKQIDLHLKPKENHHTLMNNIRTIRVM